MEIERIKIKTDDIGLAAVLKFGGLVGTGGEGKHLIQSGLVRVNGRIERRRGHRVGAGDRVEILGEDGAVQATLHVEATPT
jgi:ribosome-associated protein